MQLKVTRLNCKCIIGVRSNCFLGDCEFIYNFSKKSTFCICFCSKSDHFKHEVAAIVHIREKIVFRFLPEMTSSFTFAFADLLMKYLYELIKKTDFHSSELKLLVALFYGFYSWITDSGISGYCVIFSGDLVVY